MGTDKLAPTELRNTLHRLRDSSGWSMAAMAELLGAKGITAYPSTIAKIEAGTRAVQIDELVAYAEIFDVSTDLLLGHTSTGTGDKFELVDRLLEQMKRATWVIQSSRVALGDAVSDLDGHKLTKEEKMLCEGGSVTCDALATACAVIDATLVRTEQELDRRDARK
jgi:transcriptional regulator with XRE-family HTH domain